MKLDKVKIDSLIVVTWTDSKMLAGWTDNPDFRPAVNESVGWLTVRTKKYITLSRDRDSIGDSQPWGGQIAIPRGNIEKVRKA